MNIKTLSLYFRTVLSLKPVQVVYRLRYLIQSKLFRNSLAPVLGKYALSFPDTRDGHFFSEYGQWQKTDIESNSFCFLNEIINFKRKINWFVPDKGRLWRYNLHYFQYLLLKDGIDRKKALGIIKDWIDNNPAGTPDAWDPFPISLRLVNWLKFLCLNKISSKDNAFIIKSMVQQTICLEKHLEYHLQGNHLFKNGKALILSGVFFKGPEADRWLQKGLKIINRELDEQILDDGGHFERSPMYHSMILEDCLDLINICEQNYDPGLKNLVTKLRDKADLMIGFLLSMSHPDGQISLFNDAAFGIEAEPVQLAAYYEKVCGKKVITDHKAIERKKDSGYYILAPDIQTKMIIDCGKIGPNYQPGHAHCDTLSLELSVKGIRVIVDSGCFKYEDGAIRQYNRGNIGHNTITIDNENQSEVWGAHRCARKAEPLTVECRQIENGSLFFRGGHDGYKRLKGKPVHFREVTFHDQAWNIHDRIEGKGKHLIESRLHLNPLMELEFKEDEVIVRNKEERFLKICLMKNHGIKVEKGWYCPEFGKKYECDVLVYQADKVDLPFECGWKMEMVN